MENYCFGHHEMDVRLCPLTQATLINHNGAKPNAKLRWGRTSKSRPDIDRNNNLLLLDAEQLLNYANSDDDRVLSPLTLEVVATRDIAEGEEIFLDYGTDWEEAYNMHVASWKSALMPNRQKETPATRFECCLEPAVISAEPVVDEESYHARNWHQPKNWEPEFYKIMQHNNEIRWYPCKVLKQNGDGTIKVVAYTKGEAQASVIRKFSDLPRSALRRSVPPYSSSQHTLNAFRHFVPLPDTLVPPRWRSDYQPADEFKLGEVETGIDAKLPEHQKYRTDHEETLRNVKCGVYFAPSNIPEAGFSAYTAVPYAGKNIGIVSTVESYSFVVEIGTSHH